MNKENSLFAFFITIILGIGLGLAGVACQERKAGNDQPRKTPTVQPKEKGEGHVAHHQGCLNAIETCEVGHAETKIEGDTLKVWFVGGGTETGKSVRVSDHSIALTITTPQKETKSLVLEPRPNALAEEKAGDCSYFEGKAPWLSALKVFNATGKVSFKGRERKMVIEYPKGYDPD